MNASQAKKKKNEAKAAELAEIMKALRHTSAEQVEWLCNEPDLSDYFAYDVRRKQSCSLSISEYAECYKTATGLFSLVKGFDANFVIKHLLMLIQGHMKIDGLCKWVGMQLREQPRAGEELSAVAPSAIAPSAIAPSAIAPDALLNRD